MSVSQCFFEYGQRWPELRTYIERLIGERSLDGAPRDSLDIILEAMETRDRDIEDHLNNRPCGGGARVYCDRQYRELDSGTSSAQLEAEVTFTLSSRSTVGITIAFTFDQDPIPMGVASPDFDWYVDGVLVIAPPLLRSTPVVATATTLDPGDHTIVATLTTGAMNLVDGQVSVLVVIGDDTGADCVELVVA